MDILYSRRLASDQENMTTARKVGPRSEAWGTQNDKNYPKDRYIPTLRRRGGDAIGQLGRN